jgi:hypothetical protein
MTWRRRLLRRLLWASVLAGLVVLLAAVSVLRVGLWVRDSFAADRWAAEPRRAPGLAAQGR